MVCLTRFVVKILIVFMGALVFNSAYAYGSASVSLRWDANVPAPEGYRVFAREAGGAYDYEHPIWENSLTTCTLTGLTEGVTYYFVVRAFEGDLESVDSDEVSYTPPIATVDPVADNNGDDSPNTDEDSSDSNDSVTETDADRDGDNIVDSQDMFPDDPNEWADQDQDGIGNNQDTDDDNDGMTDAWEVAHGLDPFVDDAQLDSDGDGVTNLDEFLAASEPTSPSDNTAPDAPVIDNASDVERVNLTPVLLCGEYFDLDNDEHYQTHWQISTDPDFMTLILEATTTTQLYSYTVGEMVLDADTVYYWRAQFIDTDNQASDWSETGAFTTIAVEGAGDTDLDGILDDQTADPDSDVNRNGVADALENNIMTINTVEGQTTVGVESMSDTVTLVSVKSLPSESIADRSVNLGFGLVGFKLYLQDGVKTASVKIHFLKRVPKNAQLYKYSIESGWYLYQHADFAANRKSVTLVLEDGGMGDEDGVVNGVIVDPCGIVYADDSAMPDEGAAITTSDASSSGGSGGSCFISTATADMSKAGAASDTTAVAMTILLLVVGCFSASAAIRVRQARSRN